MADDASDFSASRLLAVLQMLLSAQELEDVRAALVSAYADVKQLSAEAAEQAVAGLERDKRYLTDTY